MYGLRNLLVFGLAAVLPMLIPFAQSDAEEAIGPVLTECRIRAAEGYPGIKARCGEFERHLDPEDTSSPLLKLSIAIVPALSLKPEPDPFVPIAGGPGGASIRFYAGYAQAFESIRRHRDILLIDQRGTGQSELMACDFGDEIIEGQLSVEETVAYARQCLEELPHDSRFFTTSVAVQDLEALRVALGYPALNLYGSSYGTRVAQHFVRRYPDSTRSVILDGVTAPQIALGPEIAIEAQKALRAIFDRCEEDAACNEAFPTLTDRFEVLREELRTRPASIEIANPMTGELRSLTFGDTELAGTIRLFSYSPNTVALLPLMIDAAANGNLQPLAANFLATSEQMSSQLAIGMHNAVVCTEDAPFYGETEPGILEATYIGPLMTEALTAICSTWPAGIIDDGFHAPLKTDKPVLLLSGGADPVTPPAYAMLAAQEMSNSLALVGKDQGHGLAGQGCMPDIIGEFVDAAAVDGLETACMERLFAMPFFLSFAGPGP